MNKIYKVVWSRARGCYVVASEFAKNTAKGASVKALAAVVLAAGLMAGGISGSAWADGTIADANKYVVISSKGNNQQFLSQLSENGYHKESLNNTIVYVKDGYTVTESELNEKGYSVATEVRKTGQVDGDIAAATQAKTNLILSDSSNNVDEKHNIIDRAGVHLNSVNLGTYAAAANAGGTRAQINYKYKDEDGKEFSNDNKNIVILTSDKKGNYFYNDEKVDPSNVYFLSDETGKM